MKKEDLRNIMLDNINHMLDQFPVDSKGDLILTSPKHKLSLKFERKADHTRSADGVEGFQVHSEELVLHIKVPGKVPSE